MKIIEDFSTVLLPSTHEEDIKIVKTTEKINSTKNIDNIYYRKNSNKKMLIRALKQN